MSLLTFPPNFVWGTATAALQVEGQNFNNDWWDWEQVPGHIREGATSRVACDWWGGRDIEDFDRARALGTTAHRLSIEWSRIEPSEGEFDRQAIDRYRQMLRALLERGLRPFVTLHHFTNPRWLAAQGGWENPAVAQKFARFARRAVEELGDLCSDWITLNEPNVYAYIGYVEGQWPPGVKDLSRSLRVMRNQIRAHAGAFYAMKDRQPESRIGLAHHFRGFYPARADSALDRLTAFLRDHIFNNLILRALEDGHLRFPVGAGQYLPEIIATQDLIGVNYYYTEDVAFDLTRPAELFGRMVLSPYTAELRALFSSAGNIELRGLERTLRMLRRMSLPIYITENGVFDDGGLLQRHYLVTHLAAVYAAMQAGADVRGYFWWTLVDNFEWAEGFSARFGLYHLDVESQQRTARPVADVYARIIGENGVDEALLEQYGRPN